MTALRWRRLALAVLLLAYALLVHYSNLGTAPPALGAALALAPLLLALAATLRRRRALTLALAIATAALLLWRLWGEIEQHFVWIYLCQQCALYAALGLAFGRTLLPGQMPLCSRWAALLHGALTTEALRYTRAVTRLWALFFAALVAATLLLYLYAPHRVWSLFVNFLILPAAVLLFAAEWLWRRRALPNLQHASLRDMAQLLGQGSKLLHTDRPAGARLP